MELIGRKQEVKGLTSQVDKLITGSSSIVWIQGPAGIGKSAMLQWMKVYAASRELQALTTRIAGPGMVENYRPIVELVGDLLRSLPDPEESKQARWYKRFGNKPLEIAGEVLSIVPGLSVAAAGYKIWLILRSPDDTGKEIDDKALLEKYENNRVGFFIDIIFAAAAQKPLVICIDDLQWADAGTVEVLLALIRGLGEASTQPRRPRLMIVWAFRPADAMEGVRERIESTIERYFKTAEACELITLELGPMPANDIPAFANHIFGRPCQVCANCSQWLFSETNGNPLQLRSTLRLMKDNGLLVERAGVIELVEPFDEQGDPPESLKRNMEFLRKVSDATASEVMALPAPVRRFLEAGSIWGRTFPIDYTARMAALSEAEKFEAVRSSLQRGLIGEDLMLAGSVMAAAGTFTSDSNTRFLLKNQPAAQKRSFHEQAAQWWIERINHIRDTIEKDYEGDGGMTDAQSNQLRGLLIKWTRESASHLEKAHKPLEAIRQIVAAEKMLIEKGFIGALGDKLFSDPSSRKYSHQLFPFLNFVDSQISSLRPQIDWPIDLRHAMELEVEHSIAIAQFYGQLEWYARAKKALEQVEMPLDYLNSAKLKRKWLLKKYSIMNLSGNTNSARRCLEDYKETLALASMTREEWSELIEEILSEDTLKPALKLIEEAKKQAKENFPELLEKIKREELWGKFRGTFFTPWNPEEKDELGKWLKNPDLVIIKELYELGSETFENMRKEVGDDIDWVQRSVIIDLKRMIEFFDRLASLAHKLGDQSLRLRCLTTAQERLEELIQNVEDEKLEELTPGEKRKVSSLLQKPPFSEESRKERVRNLANASKGTIDPYVLYCLVTSEFITPKRAIEMATPFLTGKANENKLNIASALVNRKDVSKLPIENLINWLSSASKDLDLDLEDREFTLEILANYYMYIDDKDNELKVRLELAKCLQEAQDNEQWAANAERCTVLGCKLGDFVVARELSLRGFSVDGEIRLPDDSSLPDPLDPLAAEHEAELSISMGKRADDPEVAEAWFQRALRLFDRVPDGAVRKDDIWEDISKKWSDFAYKLYEDLEEDEEVDSSQEKMARDRSLSALREARNINVFIGDQGRVDDIEDEILELTMRNPDYYSVAEWTVLLEKAFTSRLERGDIAATINLLKTMKDYIDQLENYELVEEEDGADFEDEEELEADDEDEAGAELLACLNNDQIFDYTKALKELFDEFKQKLTEEIGNLGEQWDLSDL